jgi:hypothetical protein
VKDGMLNNFTWKDVTKGKAISKDELKRQVIQQLHKMQTQSRLQLVMQNATNNYNIDHNIIDPAAFYNFEKISQKWPITLQTYVDVAFDGVAEVLRMHKKEKQQPG